MSCCTARIYLFVVRWVGVPAPIRFAAWAVHLYRNGREDWPEFNKRFPGCGCVLVLKRWAERAT